MKKESDERIRIAVIDYRKCAPQKCGYLCMNVCPVNRLGKECIVKSAENAPQISETLCTGCRICVHKCPFNAISIVNLSASLGKPVHQFGKNGFRLYGLPTPSDTGIVGLIGRNGIGKSTALSILAGKIIPNLGEGRGKDYSAVTEFFKGRELQAFFESLAGKKAGVSFKPQRISAIPEKFKGSVRELLQQFNESGNEKTLRQTAEEFSLAGILSSSVAKISGGELQRCAIAAAMLKNAELYFFDEPTSYLDVGERLRVAKQIRALAQKGKKVMVVEHDLAVLDYLSDFVHVLFGQKAVYGAIGSRQSVRNGINQYLEGYLKTENIRFRDREIRFDVRSPAKSSAKKKAMDYPALEKKFRGFFLKAEPGTIMKGEVLGILGPNATGKTTFVKMLAGILKPDNTSLDSSLRVSLKPQYLQPEREKTVQEFIAESNVEQKLFNSEALPAFNLRELLERNLEELSGGELQKVAVSVALCRDADLVLLDEPSAFLDIEERLNAASLIKSITLKRENACLVVDHDLLFQDFLSDRLIVFEGVPSRRGHALPPQEMESGMNEFLSALGITFRRDPQTGRPRANKFDSQKDKEQKKKDKYYYA